MQHVLLLLTIPILTMGTLADEWQEKRHRLLQCAPVTAFEVVFAKYLSLLSLVMGILLSTTIYPLFLYWHADPEWGQIIGCYMGLILVALSHTAVCLFISGLSRSSFHAYLFSLIAMLGLFFLGSASMLLQGGSWLGGTLHYLAVATHLEPFFQGLVTVANVTYFVCLTLAMIFLSALSLLSRRWA